MCRRTLPIGMPSAPRPCTVMTGQQWSGCNLCGRALLEQGTELAVEAARDQNGNEAFVLWVNKLFTAGGATGKRNRELLADLAIRLEEYCETGTLEVPRELNVLVPGEVWEFKVGTLRAPFFKCNDGHPPVSRITHGFFKRTPRTPRGEIDRARAIRREDLKR